MSDSTPRAGYPTILNRCPFASHRARPEDRPDGRTLTFSAGAFEGDSAEVVLPTTLCHRGGLRPGDKVEIYVQNSDTGKEIVIRRCSR